MQRINCTNACINIRNKVPAKIMMFHWSHLSLNRIVTLKNVLQTRWYSNMNAFEKQIILKLYLQLAISDDASLPMNTTYKSCVYEGIDVISWIEPSWMGIVIRKTRICVARTALFDLAAQHARYLRC